jgi:hypothetical protein
MILGMMLNHLFSNMSKSLILLIKSHQFILELPIPNPVEHEDIRLIIVFKLVGLVHLSFPLNDGLDVFLCDSDLQFLLD